MQGEPDAMLRKILRKQIARDDFKAVVNGNFETPWRKYLPTGLPLKIGQNITVLSLKESFFKSTIGVHHPARISLNVDILLLLILPVSIFDFWIFNSKRSRPSSLY